MKTSTIVWNGISEDLVGLVSRLVELIPWPERRRAMGDDGLHLWWEERRQELRGLKQLVINMDNGPECSGRSTQFLLRLTEFADMTGLCIRIIYYPPYHSKYNNIERYQAGLEKSWNGYLLDTVETVIRRAGNFFWNGLRTTVRLLDGVYGKGIKLPDSI
jgi:hypothetical protein